MSKIEDIRRALDLSDETDWSRALYQVAMAREAQEDWRALTDALSQVEGGPLLTSAGALAYIETLRASAGRPDLLDRIAVLEKDLQEARPDLLAEIGDPDCGVASYHGVWAPWSRTPTALIEAGWWRTGGTRGNDRAVIRRGSEHRCYRAESGSLYQLGKIPPQPTIRAAMRAIESWDEIPF